MNVISKMESDTVFLRSLLRVFLVIVSMTVFTNGALFFPRHIKPIHYDIMLMPCMPEDLQGQMNVTINITEEMYMVHMQTNNLEIIEPTLTHEDLRNCKRNNKAVYTLTDTRRLNDTLALYFNVQLPPGVYILKLIFINRTNENVAGVFRPFGINEKGDIIRFLDSDTLRTITTLRFLPYRSEPRVIANFTFSLRHQTSTALPMEYTVKNGIIWTYFRNNSVTSTHLVAIAVSDLVRLSSNINVRTNINIWYRRQAESSMYFALKIIKKITAFLKDIHLYLHSHLGKIDAVNHVAIPEFQGEGSSCYTWGLIPYREADIIYDEKLNDFVRKVEVTRLVTRKIVHDCLGHMSTWVDKGLAKFLEAVVIDKVLNSYQMMDLFVVQNQRESFYLDNSAENITTSPCKVNMSSSFPCYIRAPFLLRMLEGIISRHVFLKGIQKYLEKHAPVLPKDPDYLWSAIQTVLNEPDCVLHFKSHALNVKDVMNAWVKQESYPILYVTRSNNGYIHISIENLNELDKNSLEIPLTYTTQTCFDFNRTLDVVWIKEAQSNHSTIQILTEHREDDWIIVNLQQIGYYRVNYDNDNWLQIAKYLNSEKYTNIHVLNRAQIIDDAFYLMLIRKLNSSIFWNITSYLSRETSYVAWYPMIKAIENISSIFSLSDDKVERIKMKLLFILEGILEKIGYYDKFEYGLTASLRQEAARWACVFGSHNCTKAAADILQRSSTNPETYKIMPWWKEWTYCNSFKIPLQNNIIWFTEFQKYMNKSGISIMKFLTCSEDVDVVTNYTSLVMNKNDEEKMQNFDYIKMCFYMIARYSKNNLILNYVLNAISRFQKIYKVVLFIYTINHVHSEKQLYEILDFVKNKEETLVLYIKCKIAKRLSEIKTQMNFVEILIDY